MGEGRREDGVREGLRMRNPNTGSQRSGSPAQGCHLPDGDFKDLIEFALEQRCLDTNRGKGVGRGWGLRTFASWLRVSRVYAGGTGQPQP